MFDFGRSQARWGRSLLFDGASARRGVGPFDPFGFSWPWLFRFENHRERGRISLDFLEFSRQNRDLSMGYTDFVKKVFSPSLSRGTREAPEREAAVLG
jgi:hypothetical protein